MKNPKHYKRHMPGSKPRAGNPGHARTISVSTSAFGAQNERKMAVITVELEHQELHVLITMLHLTLSKMPGWGAKSADMKALLARIEYLEGLK